jgi:hypothetical protein
LPRQIWQPCSILSSSLIGAKKEIFLFAQKSGKSFPGENVTTSFPSNTACDRCYDFINIFAKKLENSIGVFLLETKLKTLV